MLTEVSPLVSEELKASRFSQESAVASEALEILPRETFALQVVTSIFLDAFFLLLGTLVLDPFETPLLLLGLGELAL